MSQNLQEEYNKPFESEFEKAQEGAYIEGTAYIESQQKLLQKEHNEAWKRLSDAFGNYSEFRYSKDAKEQEYALELRERILPKSIETVRSIENRAQEKNIHIRLIETVEDIENMASEYGVVLDVPSC